jgi:oligopeptide transport system substrate-binding protein
VSIVSVPNPDWWPQRYLEADWDLAIQTWTPMPDPHIVYARRYASWGMHNAPGYENPKFDRIIEAAAQVTDPPRRLELYREAEMLRAADSPTLYLVYPDRTAWMKHGVSGLIISPGWSVDLTQVRKKDKV